MKPYNLGFAAILALILTTASVAPAAQTAEACKAAKVKAASTATVSKLKCHATAAKKGVAVDTQCLVDADTKFSVAFVKIEAKGGCSPSGDQADYTSAIDAFVEDVVLDNLCPAKTSAIGSSVKGNLKCEAKAIKKGTVVDADCLAAAEEALVAAFDKADSKGCMPSGGADAAQGQIDELVATMPLSSAPTCIDGVANGSETDVDCGGGSCPACGIGDQCGMSTDCASNLCDSGVCTNFVCLDGMKNGSESDTDCGGSSCPACGSGRSCGTGTDCSSGVCTSLICS
jgi:hypothetical protein